VGKDKKPKAKKAKKKAKTSAGDAALTAATAELEATSEPLPALTTTAPDLAAGHEPRLAPGLTRLVNALGGAELCYGEPVHVGDRIVVPVARVRGAGGSGFGRGRLRGRRRGPGEDDDNAEGAGGAIEATPAGFLDITPDGVRYEAIPDPVTTARAISTGASTLTLLLSAVLGARRLTRRRSGRLLLPRR